MPLATAACSRRASSARATTGARRRISVNSHSLRIAESAQTTTAEISAASSLRSAATTAPKPLESAFSTFERSIVHVRLPLEIKRAMARVRLRPTDESGWRPTEMVSAWVIARRDARRVVVLFIVFACAGTRTRCLCLGTCTTQCTAVFLGCYETRVKLRLNDREKPLRPRSHALADSQG